MRLVILILIFVLPMVTVAQKKYHCEYAGTVSFLLPDSNLQSIRKSIEEKDLGSELTKQILKQFSTQLISSSYRCTVNATPDSIFILNEKGEEDEGNMVMRMKSQLLLMHKGEIYQFDSTTASFSPWVNAEVPKSFLPEDETKIIKGYPCKRYVSSDSSCIVWVAPDLPSYINPGIKATNLKGAILSSQLKRKGMTTELEIDKIE